MYILMMRMVKGERRLGELRQRFYRIYEASPDISRDRLVGLFKKATKQSMLAETVVDMLGKHDVRTIARELRRRCIPVSVIDVFNAFEKLRRNGYLRVIGTSLPEKKIREKEVKTVSQKIITPAVMVSPPKVETPPVEAPPIDMSEIPPPTEMGVPLEVQPVIPQQVAQVEVIMPMHLVKIVEAIKKLEIFERYLEFNEHIRAIVLASREANIVLHSVYRDINVTDATALAFLATISDHSDRVSKVLGLGEFRETIVEATQFYIMISRLKYDLVLATIFDKSIGLGLMIRDFLSLKGELALLI